MTNWTPHPAVGYLPFIFQEEDPRSAQEQANDRYSHGGGWNSFGDGWTLTGATEPGKAKLSYPDDPDMLEMARAPFREQTLLLFQYGWVAIAEGDKLIDVARID